MDIKVSSITLLDREESKTRAMATLVINDEFAVHGIKVIEGKNGEFVQMPSKRDMYGNYNDIVFPVTAELREQINNAVLERYRNPISYEDLQLIGSYETKCDIPEAERVTLFDAASHSYAENANVTLSQLQAALIDAKQFAAARKTEEQLENAEQEQKTVRSKIYASMRSVSNNNHIKSSGQIVIDDAIVITGVRVTEATVTNTAEDGTKQEAKKTFVNMPSYQTETGDYNQYAHPITRACYDKINSCVMAAYENIGRYTYKGVKFAELGDKQNVSSFTDLNNKFAEKLMSELDKRNIPYNAKIAETTTLSVKSADKETVDNTRKELKDSLTQPKHGGR
ncbi:MAG: SpoVG family protein [Eubacterium sp.]|nr:SpoVG family protein [Eubacterium sp.]